MSSGGGGDAAAVAAETAAFSATMPSRDKVAVRNANAQCSIGFAGCSREGE